MKRKYLRFCFFISFIIWIFILLWSYKLLGIRNFLEFLNKDAIIIGGAFTMLFILFDLFILKYYCIKIILTIPKKEMIIQLIIVISSIIITYYYIKSTFESLDVLNNFFNIKKGLKLRRLLMIFNIFSYFLGYNLESQHYHQKKMETEENFDLFI